MVNEYAKKPAQCDKALCLNIIYGVPWRSYVSGEQDASNDNGNFQDGIFFGPCTRITFTSHYGSCAHFVEISVTNNGVDMLCVGSQRPVDLGLQLIPINIDTGKDRELSEDEGNGKGQ